MSKRRDIKSGFLIIEEYRFHDKITDPRPCLNWEEKDVRLFPTREEAQACVAQLRVTHPSPNNYTGTFKQYAVYDMGKPLNYAKVAVRLMQAFDELEGHPLIVRRYC